MRRKYSTRVNLMPRKPDLKSFLYGLAYDINYKLDKNEDALVVREWVIMKCQKVERELNW
jgi:hypothetical protein